MAAITDGQGHFSVDVVEILGPEAHEVLIDIMAAGLCHTDYDSLRWDRPLVLGHEGAGIVKSVGAYVNHVQPGDHVVLNWATPCDSCFQCVRGNPSLCENRRGVPEARTQHRGQGLAQSFRLGTMSTAAVVRKEAVVKIDVDIPFASAAIVGCGVMTGYGKN